MTLKSMTVWGLRIFTCLQVLIIPQYCLGVSVGRSNRRGHLVAATLLVLFLAGFLYYRLTITELPSSRVLESAGAMIDAVAVFYAMWFAAGLVKGWTENSYGKILARETCAFLSGIFVSIGILPSVAIGGVLQERVFVVERVIPFYIQNPLRDLDITPLDREALIAWQLNILKAVLPQFENKD